MKPILLASASKRRVEIMSYFTIPFEPVFHRFDERSVPYEGNAEEYVKTVSTEKAKSIAHLHPNNIILAADTIVVHEGTVLHKAQDKDDAVAILSRLSGCAHQVVTGVCVICDGVCFVDFDITTVYMAPLTSKQIDAFLQTNLWNDKAAAYAIQGVGSLLVERIEGCYYNVIGLPVRVLSKLLGQVGIDLWQYVQ